jgi:DNA uptake protein ComE-like DNA-binding protein
MVSTLDRRNTSTTPLGQVLRLPCKFIQGTSTTSPMVIDTIAKELANTGKNVLPVMVKIVKQDKYAAVLNTKVLLAAKQAGLDFVYCIVVDEEMAAQLKVETGKTIKVNLNLASESDLIAAFENIKTNLTALNKIEPAIIARSIVQYRNSDRIKDLTFLTKLKCGIGKAKLPLLSDRLMY